MSSEFENCFVTILDKHAPLRQHKVRNTYAPYIDHELRHKMFLHDFYRKQFNKTKPPDTWKQFQQLRNKINIERQKKKTEFFTRKLNEHKGDVRSTWKVLNMALGSKSKETNFNTLNVKGKEISDLKEIANALNSHFCTTAKRVWEQSTQSQIKDATDLATFESFISQMPKTTKIFKFRKVTPGEVTKAIAKLKNSRVVVIPSRFLKDASSRTAFLLASIFSESLEIGVFPDNLKLARISAIFKGKGFRSNPDHCRPISVLSVIARLCEKIVHQQLYDFLKESLSVTQSGFKPGCSTETSLLNTTNRCILNIDKKYLNLTLFLDLRKAFDTVAHEILIQKMDFYGIKDIELAWFKS